MEQQPLLQQPNNLEPSNLTTYLQVMDDLDNYYDLDQLEVDQNIDYQNNIDKAKEEFDKTLDRANRKGMTASHDLGRAIKKVLMVDVVQHALAELDEVGTKELGYNLDEMNGRKDVLGIVSKLWSDYYNLFDHEMTREDRDREWERMIFIAFNEMIDVAAIPHTNSFPTNPQDEWDEERNDAEKKSLQKIYTEVGNKVLFQTQLTFMKRFYPKRFGVLFEECDRGGLSSYAYFESNFREKIKDYVAWRTDENDKHIDQSDVEKTQQIARDRQKINLLNQISLLRGRETKIQTIHQGQPKAERFKAILGSWLCSMIEENTDIFVQVPRDPYDKTNKRRSVLTYNFSDDTYQQILGVVRNREFFKTPMIAPPLPITNQVRGGSERTKNDPPVKSHKGYLEISDKRLAFYQRQSMVDFTINEWVFDLLTQLKNQNLELGEFHYYYRPDYELTPSELLLNQVGKPEGWDNWEQRQKDKWCRGHSDWRKIKDQVRRTKEKHHRKLSTSAPSRSIYHTAERYKDREAIWFNVAPEFRGRIMTDAGLLNYQGRDSAKALIDLARSVELQTPAQFETARKWISNHLASCFGGSLDKKPFDIRIHKVGLETFQRDITAVATMLDDEGSFAAGFQVLKRVVKNNGKPLMFARSCKEFYDLFIACNRTDTNLLCGVDATCSGQQIQAGWVQSKRLAKFVNLLPDTEPQDLYGEIWKVLWEMVERCVVTDDEGRKIEVSWSDRNVKALNENGMGRTIVKGAFQPMSYGSGQNTCVQGILNKIEKLRHSGSLHLTEPEILAVKENVIKAINEVSSVGIVNKWFRHFAERCAAAGLPYITIPTMLGDHVKMIYQTEETEVITTFKTGSMTYRRDLATSGSKRKSDRTGGRGQRLRFVVPTGEPDHDKWITGLPANTTHSAGDATILADCLWDADFGFATQHDAIYCSALDVDEVRDRFRRSYVKVAKFDIFEELQEANGVRVDPTKIVDPRTMDAAWDTLEEDVLGSDYIIN